MQLNSLYSALAAQLSCGILMNEPLSRYGTWRIGGPADMIISPRSIADVSLAQRYIYENNIPSIVVGDGSNILFDDDGFRGIVIHIGSDMSAMKMHDDGRVVAQGGIWVPSFVSKVGRAGWQGCEHAIGVPGTLGGLVVMNGGTSRRGIGEQLTQAVAVNHSGDVQNFSREECQFLYRTSIFQKNRSIIVEASFQYERGDKAVLRTYMLKTLQERNRKFPRKMPNCGSVFLSDPSLYATVGPPGKAIEQAGMKGVSCGGALISPLHANFIVNTGNASSDDILHLIAQIRSAVFKTTGHKMNCEVRHLRPDGIMLPAHVSAEERFPSA
ncbi:MAG: UDP-N-acetylmuramate dehydrogenase [Alphaproteobacteria bacterium]